MNKRRILKCIVCLVALSSFNSALSQSRKLQIESLSKQVDSLNGVIVAQYGLMAQGEEVKSQKPKNRN